MIDSTQEQRVLILDDDEVMRELLEALLSLQGYAVVPAASGADALDLLRNDGPFDIVLTDLQLPELSGQALAERLRAAVGADTLLVGMSGRLALDGERRLLDAFLTKPFDTAHFEDAVRAARNRQSPSGTSSPGADLTASPAPPSTPAVRPALNEDIFSSLAKTLPITQLVELYNLTVNDVAKRHKRIEEAAAQGDLGTVQREAHAIKGSCGMVGATELQFLAAATEEGTTPNTVAISEFPAACMRLRRMLDAKLQTA